MALTGSLNNDKSAKLESILFGLFLALIFWAPLPFGSNRGWSAAILMGVLFLIAVIWFAALLCNRTCHPQAVFQKARYPLTLLIIIQCWVALQLLPLPLEIIKLLSPRAALLQGESSFIPLSLDTQATWLYLLKGLAYSVSFFLVIVLVNSRQRVESLLWMLILSGTFQAVYGCFMVLTGYEWGFFVEKYANLGLATGTFVNRNHLAGYLVMSLAAGIGLLISGTGGARLRNRRDRMRYPLELMVSGKLMLRILLALMVIGLIMTRSRMGNISFFLSLTIAGAVALFIAKKFSWPLLLLLLSMLIVDTWLLGQWFGFDQVATRIQQTVINEEQRTDVFQQTGSLVKDFPLTGSGGGSYYGLFEHYQNSQMAGFITHAHNDYLEITAELGVLGLMLFGVLVVLTSLRCLMLLRTESRLNRGIGFLTCMVIFWVLIHSLADFNLQIPANAMTLTVLLALAWINPARAKAQSP